MTIDEIIGQLEASVEHALSGDEVSAWEDTIPVQLDIIRLLKKRLPMAGCGPGCEPKVEKLKATCDKLIAACDAPRGEEAGRLFPGDGSFLKNFAEFLKVVIPMILVFIPK